MNIIEAAKAVLADYDGGHPECGPVLYHRGLIEALRKAVADAEGMVLVPSEPTDEMAHAAVQYIDEEPEYYYKWNTAKEVYKAMLAAAEVKP